MTTVEVLKAARARIERGWCQHKNASDAAGHRLGPFDTGAVAWCAQGAIDAATQHDTDAWERGLDLLEGLVGRPASAWNDAPGRTQAEVLAAFDRAIALAEAEAQP